ncbi:MAG TPA: histidine phosphatase family protein [Turneriella sp.]|nr:histidine phosphatase family protein [Turneriella sp.]HNE19091.1 histidine phosphatase family protein [Turneriella sp.]
MTELYLVRHGQADSAGDNYDQLTETGHEQARLVGEWLAERGYTFTRALHGGLRRQQETLEAIAAAYARHGQDLPAAELHPAFAEFDLRVWAIIAGKLRHGHAEFSELLKQWNRARHENSPDKGDIFKQLTGIILREWVAMGEHFTEAESFPAFRRRVLGALELQATPATASGKAQRILAVTSGGPIALLTGGALGLSQPKTLGLMRRIYNTSLHALVYDKSQWELQTFNNVPHLPAADRTLV